MACPFRPLYIVGSVVRELGHVAPQGCPAGMACLAPSTVEKQGMSQACITTRADFRGGHISVTGGGLRGGLMAKREPGRGCLGMARAGGLGARWLRYRTAKYPVIRAEEKGLGN